MIAVVDYRAGNLASVCKALSKAGAEVRVVDTPSALGGARAIVVPGVGHFAATAALDGAWRDAIRSHVAAGGPLMGICLGMQWLFEASAEAPGCPGLGLLPGCCYRIAAGADRDGRVLKVPHVGWNSLTITRPVDVLAGVADSSYVYFTHSYAAPIGPDCAAIARHGADLAAVVARGRVVGTQFHPEKSGDTGLRILQNFVRLVQGREEPC